jgi:hypothetical protein
MDPAAPINQKLTTPYIYIYIYSSTLAVLTLIILFSEMLKFSENIFFSKKNKIEYEIRESFEKILFFNMDSSKLIK